MFLNSLWENRAVSAIWFRPAGLCLIRGYFIATEFETMTDAQIRRIADPMRNWFEPGGSVENALSELLSATDSRAVGLWRLEGASLRLVGFQAKSDMPESVQAGFAEATREVPLDQTGLGIVKAVLHRGPAVAHVEAGETGLSDSASWLVKFAAVMSLAVPILDREEIVGVLAMSTANPFYENDETWRLLAGVAERLGD